jgi:16S rRNA A1518/A1519 N6-dimethyltransferase RsmA/KsgA/DIM1 with predicted DNA glycosylase/AP lyase activity
VHKAKGDVLIAGLGLGMIILAIQGKREVKSITVVEKDPQLGEIVLAQLQQRLLKKVTIVFQDIFKYKTEDKFDTIYFDIWNKLGHESDYQQMVQLKRMFKRNRVKPIKQSPILCWREVDAKRCSRPIRSGTGVNLWW